MRGKSRFLAFTAAAVAFVVLCTLAVISPGFDTRETPKLSNNVWTFRDSGQYARVNTTTAEIDTVRQVEEPSTLMQGRAIGILFTQGNSKAFSISQSNPADIGDASEKETAGDTTKKASSENSTGGQNAQQLPGGVRDTIQAGKYVLLRTARGKVFIATIGKKQLKGITELNPISKEEKKERAAFAADAAAVSASGKTALFNAQNHKIYWYDPKQGDFVDQETVPDQVGADAKLTFVGKNWVLLSKDAKRIWVKWAKDAINTGASADAILQIAQDADADSVLLADGRGLVRIAEQKARRTLKATGIPAQPVSVGEKVQAAWISKSAATVWDSTGSKKQLDLDPDTDITGTPQPVIHSNGDKAILTEQRTGMSWTLPEGRLIPVKQWALAENPNPDTGTVVVADVSQQEPPVALPDSFGVRAGVQTSLPVLLNDSDPNKQDVLTIVPEETGLPASFGTVELLADGQTFTIRPDAQASGTAQFSYRVTDGIDTSAPTTVTLRVVPANENTAPAWCPVNGCQREWGIPAITPGGTLQVPVLETWVDPEGDQFTLQNVEVSGTGAADVRALVTEDGRLAIRHVNAGGNDSDAVLHLTVSDSHGETVTKNLPLKIKQSARAQFQNYAETVQTGTRTVLQPTSRIIGGSGNYKLTNATVQTGQADVSVTSDGKLAVQMQKAGIAVIAITAEDSNTHAAISGSVRVTAAPGNTKLAMPPLRAFVQQLADTTVDVLSAIPGSRQQALAVTDAVTNDGNLRADILEDANVRVAGSTADGNPGKIGTIALTVSAGSQQLHGDLTVFQVAPQPAAIAMPDTVTVRAGNVADIRVLDNDVSSPGTRLILHPQISGSGADGELAFASGNTLRYLAPKTPGNYTLQYTGFVASSPEVADVGTVQVTVLPQQGNRSPEPTPLTVRVGAGEKATVNVPEFGIDPDGDRVRLVGVRAGKNAQVSAEIAARSSAVTVVAADDAEPGLSQLHYTVRDRFGAEADGMIRIIVTADSDTARLPVAYSDYVRIVTGAKEPAVVHPLNNDIDPAGGELRLVAVEPLTLPGEGAQRVKQLKARLDKSKLKSGELKITATDEPGIVSYRYTVISKESGNTADGLIVVQSSSRVGATAPAIQDTLLTVSDRALLEGEGIDVVSGRVSWNGGDANKLKLTLGDNSAKSYKVSGNRVSGKYNPRGDTVTLRFTGVDAGGEEVESYAFLLIPSLDELRLNLKTGAGIKVKEENSAEASLTELVAVGAGDKAEFQTGNLQNFRTQGKCTAVNSTTIRYEAGSGEPWTDTCTVLVKLTEQSVWTRLSVPVQIAPRDPQAELQPLARTIKPGSSETIDLSEMVKWRGGRTGSLGGSTFVAGQAQGAASVVQGGASGATVKVSVHADAVPGTDIAIPISLTGEQQANSILTVRVGITLPDNPRGGTVQLDCRVGDECGAKLIGIAGEYDPFRGAEKSGLKLQSIASGECAAGKLQRDGDRMVVAWADGAAGPGGRCTATFTVADAQGRTGTGTIELDAKGVPRAPTSVQAVRAGSDSVTVSVQLAAEGSYPAATGAELVEGDSAVGSCELNGSVARCTVTGLTPGVHHTYHARAVNDVGKSQVSSASTTTWAYRPPAPPSLSVARMEWPENQDASKGRVRIRLAQPEGSTATSMLRFDSTNLAIEADEIYELPSGSHTITAYSVDDPAAVPPGFVPSSSGPETNTESVEIYGAPTPGAVTLRITGGERTNWEVQPAGFDSASPDSLQWDVSVFYKGSGETVVNGTSSLSGGGLEKYRTVYAKVRAFNAYGISVPVISNEDYTGPLQLERIDGKYWIAPATTVYENTFAVWSFSPANVDYTPDASFSVKHSLITPGQPWVSDLVQCLPDGTRCSQPGVLEPTENSVHPFSLRWNGGECIAPTSDPNVLEQHFVKDGDPGKTLEFSVDQANERDILVSFAEFPGVTAARFSNRICEAASPADSNPTSP